DEEDLIVPLASHPAQTDIVVLRVAWERRSIGEVGANIGCKAMSEQRWTDDLDHTASGNGETEGPLAGWEWGIVAAAYLGTEHATKAGRHNEYHGRTWTGKHFHDEGWWLVHSGMGQPYGRNRPQRFH